MNEFSQLLESLVDNYKKNKQKVNIDLYKIPVGISGRHIHLSQEDLDTLFGKGYKLTPIKSLSQPGQFACKECVTIAAKKGCIEPVLRLSGDIKDTPGITVIGPEGTVVLKEGTIVAQRHIHFNNLQAKERGLKNGDIVSIKTKGERSALLENVSVRVGDNGYLDCHIDQEEANALGLGPKDFIEIII